jgi:DNA adenine methylase
MAGAAALFFAKVPAEAEILNDVNGDIVNLYRVVQHHLDEFVRQFRWALTSREIFKWLQVTPIETLTDIQRASRFFYLQHHAFGGLVDRQTFGTSTVGHVGFNLLRIEEQLSSAHIRLANVIIERLDWQECVNRYDREHTLFYLDPPYWGTHGYGVEFGLEQYALIAAAARSIKGRMVVSVNDIPEMRDAFAGLAMESLSINYAVGRGGPTPRRELVIRNWK